MRIYYDQAKNERNIRLRGLSFDDVSRFDFEGALYGIDNRRDYGERRYVAVGLIGARLHVLCIAEVHDGIRVISSRKANTREVRRYAQAQSTD